MEKGVAALICEAALFPSTFCGILELIQSNDSMIWGGGL